jgi:LmbE family N-acetylglucosaminyl deacetylase
MTALAFEPHSDDIALFAAFSAMEHHAHVVTVLEGHVQQQRGLPISQQQRFAENECAMRELGLQWTQWPYRDDGPDWDAVAVAMHVIDERLQPDVVFAPAVEAGGHEQHSRVGELAGQVFGARCRFYLSYVRGEGRSRGVEVVGDADQIGRKLRALACYRSQIAEPSTRPWFLDGLTEYLA